LKKILTLSAVSLSVLMAVNADDKMYINENEFSMHGEAFHIHVGGNIWLTTNTVHRDETGLYTYECKIVRSLEGDRAEYEKKWKCPYCHQWWSIGQPCQNKDCPSKYK
jgi:hypothetical protein